MANSLKVLVTEVITVTGQTLSNCYHQSIQQKDHNLAVKARFKAQCLSPDRISYSESIAALVTQGQSIIYQLLSH